MKSKTALLYTLTATLLILFGSSFAQDIPLEVWIYQSFAGDDAPIWQKIEQFQSENPDIDLEVVVIQHGSASYRDRYVTAFQAGAGPDALMVDIEWTPQLAAMGSTLALDEFATDAHDIFYPGPLETVTYNDQLHGLPFYTNALALFYNKTLFEEAGLPLPHDGWIWDDFLNAAQTLTGDGRYGFGLLGAWGGTFEWFPWLWQNGGEIFTEDGTAVAFNNERGLEAAQFFLDVITEYGVTPEAAKTWRTWDELAAAFNAQVIAMYQVGDWGLRPVDNMNPSFEWDVAPLPMREQRASVVGGANWIINANTDQAEAAYRWVEFITGPEAFELMDGYQRLAALRGSEEQQSIVQDDPRMSVFVESLEYARARPPHPDWTVVNFDCLQPAFQSVILEGTDVAQAMSEAETCANSVLAQ